MKSLPQQTNTNPTRADVSEPRVVPPKQDWVVRPRVIWEVSREGHRRVTYTAQTLTEGERVARMLSEETDGGWVLFDLHGKVLNDQRG